jgi:hypothetical protein
MTAMQLGDLGLIRVIDGVELRHVAIGGTNMSIGYEVKAMHVAIHWSLLAWYRLQFCQHQWARKIKQFNNSIQWHCYTCHLNFTTDAPHACAK